MSGKWNSDFKFSPTPGVFDNDRSYIFWIAVLIALIIFAALLIPPDFFRDTTWGRSRVARVQADQRSMAIASEAYFVDHKAYPAWGVGMYGINHELPANDPALLMPTFLIRSRIRPKIAMLTTPVSYLTENITDPFAPTKGTYYGYWTDGRGWILYSAGPDRKYELNPAIDYNSSQIGATISLINKTYDATNGTDSGGDVYKIKQ